MWLALASFVVGGALLGAVEAVRLGVAVAPELVGLFAATGLGVGLVVVAAELAGNGFHAVWRKASWAGWVASSIRATPALLLAIPTTSTLFQGAYAATLPGATWAPFVVPAVAWLMGTVVLRWGRAVLPRRVGRVVLMAGTAVLVAGTWWVNGNWMRTGYPDLHAAASVLEVAGAGAIVFLGARATLSWRVGFAIVAVTLVGAAAVLGWGLRSPAERLLISSRGDESRHLIRLWRWPFDRDQDGAATVLGGGDCDDGDPQRFPGGRDFPGDGIDQDCDGADSSPPPADRHVVDDRSWRVDPTFASRLANLRQASVLIISVDALRADVLAQDNQGRADFPMLSGLLDESAWFVWAWSPAAGTDIALATLLTGRWDPYQPIASTLLEVASTSGRATTVIMPREVLRYAGETLMRRGVDRLERVVTDGGQRDVGDRTTAEQTTDAALAALGRAATKPVWVWAHYFDVHEHQQIPVAGSELASVRAGTPAAARPYRALLATIDRSVGRLLTEVRRLPVTAQPVVVFFSDHGESLGEDPRLPDRHGNVVYQALTHVPMAIRIPGQPGRRLETPVSLIDLGPTVLDLIGAADAFLPRDGVSQLAHVLAGPPTALPPARPLVIREALQWAVVDWPDKLLVRPADDTAELYDLARDPNERSNRAAQAPERVRELKAVYSQFPPVHLDRTSAGRAWRERQAQKPPPRAQP